MICQYVINTIENHYGETVMGQNDPLPNFLYAFDYKIPKTYSLFMTAVRVATGVNTTNFGKARIAVAGSAHPSLAPYGQPTLGMLSAPEWSCITALLVVGAGTAFFARKWRMEKKALAAEKSAHAAHREMTQAVSQIAEERAKIGTVLAQVLTRIAAVNSEMVSVSHEGYTLVHHKMKFAQMVQAFHAAFLNTRTTLWKSVADVRIANIEESLFSTLPPVWRAMFRVIEKKHAEQLPAVEECKILSEAIEKVALTEVANQDKK